MHCDWRGTPTCHNWRKPTHSNKDPEQPNTIKKKRNRSRKNRRKNMPTHPKKSLCPFGVFFLFLFFDHKTGGISSLIRDQTHDACVGSTESLPLDRQGSPLLFFFFNGLEFMLSIIPPCLGVPCIVYSPAKCSWRSGHRHCL